MSEAKSHRKIQSFVKRSGRLSKAQSLGLNDLWSDFGVEDKATLKKLIDSGKLLSVKGFGEKTVKNREVF